MQDNPFVTGDRLEAMRVTVDSSFRLSTLSIQVDAELTSAYLYAVAVALTNCVGDDSLSSGHALLWESANLVNAVVNPNAEIKSACDHDKCAHRHAPTMAFTDAAARGDFEAAMNVIKAVVKECNQQRTDPVETLCDMFASTVTSIAYSVMRSTEQPGDATPTN